MGGEHCIQFHGNNYDFCCKNESLEISVDEFNTWISLRPKIIRFVKKCRDQMTQSNSSQKERFLKETNKLLKDLISWESPGQIALGWHVNVCCGIFGDIMHDVFQVFIDNFPDKMCGLINRCSHGFGPKED